VPQYKRDFQQKLRKFREHPYMRLIPVRRHSTTNAALYLAPR